jgi:spore maturation protein CgeB
VRTAIVGSTAFDSLEYNLWETFRHLGHEAKIFGESNFVPFGDRLRHGMAVLLDMNPKCARWAYRKLERSLLEYSPDLIVVAYRHIIPDLITSLKRQRPNIPIVQINPDAIGNLHRGHIFTSPYDAYFSKEPVLVELMRKKLRLNAHYLPESFNPRVHRRPEQDKAECEEKANIDVVVAATLYPYRIRFLEQLMELLDARVRLAVYGETRSWAQTSLWRYHQGEVVTGPRKAAAFYSARIVLDNLHWGEYEGVNCRFFEALGSGGFLLCDARPSIPALATPGKELVTFETVEEAAERVRYYLAHEAERRSIASAGYARAIKDHTYERRVEQMLSVVGLS